MVLNVPSPYSTGTDVAAGKARWQRMLTGEFKLEELNICGDVGDSDLFTGVNWLRGDTCGEQKYLSLRSVSVPYPLSISVGRPRCSFSPLALYDDGMKWVF